MTEAIIWLNQEEAHDLQNCGTKAVELAELERAPVGFVIVASAIAEAQRVGKLVDQLRNEILHAYHRLIIFGGTYVPFVEISASPIMPHAEVPTPFVSQLGGKAVLTKIEEMVNAMQATPQVALIVKQHHPAMHLRAYEQTDRERCLAIFEGNTPLYFASHEVAEFAKFLNTPNCAYYVVERNNELVGCGGFWIKPEEKKAALVWGMVRSDRQKIGAGSFLLLSRLQEVALAVPDCTIHLDTSQHAFQFFEKYGFEVQKFIENHYAKDLHRYDMILKLDAERRRWITKELGKFSR